MPVLHCRTISAVLPAGPARVRPTKTVLAVLLLGAALTGCLPPGRAAAAAETPGSGGRETVYLIRRGWHTDVGFAADSLEPASLGRLTTDLPGAQTLVFGFGDRHYVLAKDKNLVEMVRALLPGPGLLLVTGLVASPQAAFGGDRVVQLSLQPQQSRRMRAFVWSSLATPEDAPGLPTPYARGPYPGSLFYAAAPRYSALYTCNTWIADVLRAGGLPVTRTGVLFAAQVWREVEDLPEAGAEPAPGR